MARRFGRPRTSTTREVKAPHCGQATFPIMRELVRSSALALREYRAHGFRQLAPRITVFVPLPQRLAEGFNGVLQHQEFADDRIAMLTRAAHAFRAAWMSSGVAIAHEIVTLRMVSHGRHSQVVTQVPFNSTIT